MWTFIRNTYTWPHVCRDLKSNLFLFQFGYGNREDQPNAVAVQVKLLQLLSKESHQSITYHCRNSVAYKDGRSSSLKKALVLRGSNGQELRAQGNVRLRYTVVEDGCSVSLQHQKWQIACFVLVLIYSDSPRNQTESGARQWLSTGLKLRPGCPSWIWPRWTSESPIRSSAWTSALCVSHKTQTHRAAWAQKSII